MTNESNNNAQDLDSEATEAAATATCGHNLVHWGRCGRAKSGFCGRQKEEDVQSPLEVKSGYSNKWKFMDFSESYELATNIPADMIELYEKRGKVIKLKDYFIASSYWNLWLSGIVPISARLRVAGSNPPIKILIFSLSFFTFFFTEANQNPWSIGQQ